MGAYDIDGVLNADLNSYIKPENFGAVGNGIHNDYISFQNAINYGLDIICESGKIYEISQSLRLRSNLNINLNGATLQKELDRSNSRIFFNFNDNSTFTGYNGNGNITIKNGFINGAGASLAHGKNITFENVIFTNCHGSHFIEICACENFTVRNCYFIGMYNNAIGIKEYINIDGCDHTSFPYLPENSAFYDGYKNNGIIIENCLFSTGNDNTFKHGYNAIGAHYRIDNEYVHKNIYISNCTIEGFENCGIRLNDMNNVFVRNCNITTLANGINIGDVANVTDVTIANNYFNTVSTPITNTDVTGLTEAYNFNKSA